jgi:DNA-binding NtrC family response regulator
MLKSYAWPGNIRELRNWVERAVLLSTDGAIEIEHFPIEKMTGEGGIPAQVSSEAPATASTSKVSLDRSRIADALAMTNGNQTQAAKLLGISRVTLSSKLDLFGFPRPRKRS